MESRVDSDFIKLYRDSPVDELAEYCESHASYYRYNQECPACMSEEDAAYGAYEELEDYFGPRE